MPSRSTLTRGGGLAAVSAGALYFLGAILIILNHPSAYLFTRQDLPGSWGLPIGLLMVGGLAGLHARHTGYPGYGPLGTTGFFYYSVGPNQGPEPLRAPALFFMLLQRVSVNITHVA